METMQAFIERVGIDCEATFAESNPNMADAAPGSTHWLVKLSTSRGKTEAYYTQGPAVVGDVDAATVLDCLASDCTLLEDEGEGDGVRLVVALGGTIESEDDYQRAKQTERVIKATRADLEVMLGADDFDALLYGVERL